MIGLGIRPEHLTDAADRREATGHSALSGQVRATEALGSELLIHLEVPAEPVLTEEVREVAGDVDAAALEQLESEARKRRTVLIARLETERRPRTNENFEVAIDQRRLHFFDLENGLAIQARA